MKLMTESQTVGISNPFQTSLLNRVLDVIAGFRAWRTRVLACLHSHVLFN